MIQPPLPKPFIELWAETASQMSQYVGLVYIAVLLAMLIDLIAGWQKAKMRGEARTSTGLKRTADKARRYLVPMSILSIADLVGCMHLSAPWLSMAFGAFLIFIEFKSVMEKNWEKEEILKAQKTMRVVVENKEDFSRMMIEAMGQLLEESKTKE